MKPAKNTTATTGAGLSAVWVADIIYRVFGIELTPLDITQLGVVLSAVTYWLPWRRTVPSTGSDDSARGAHDHDA